MVYFFAKDPNTKWEIWKNLFLEVLDKHAPFQNKKVRTKMVPRTTSSIKELINCRDKLKRIAIISGIKHDWLNYKKMRNRVNIQMRLAKKLLLYENCW